MKVLFELSGDHPTLPVSEIRACLRACEMDAEELYHN
ncbi:MAG: RNA methyltransferase, partial [Thermoplasmata archaeon]